MALLELKIAPDPVLKTRAEEVTDVNDEIRQLLSDMVETMYANDGCGLAANQVGVLKRVIVVDVAAANEPPNPLKFINPVLTYLSEEQTVLEDGCLSIPDLWFSTSRSSRVKMDYLDEQGQQQSLETDGILAYALQHETDHLNGKLFIEYLSPFKQRMVMDKLVKYKKARERRGK